MASSRGRRGIGSIEILIATVIVGVLMVAALRALGAAVRANVVLAHRAKAVLLADELLTEILQAKFTDPDVIDSFGREAGESATQRSTFDDVDDYDGWSASPPVDRNGTAKPDATGWQRTVEVGNVNPTAVHDSFLASTTNTGVKRIVVRVLREGEELARAEGIQTASWSEALSDNDPTNPLPSPVINLPPRADLWSDKIAGKAPLTVALDAGNSADPEGGTLTFYWAMDGIEALGTNSRTAIFAIAGLHTAQVRVVDDHGGQDIRQLWFVVE